MHLYLCSRIAVEAGKIARKELLKAGQVEGGQPEILEFRLGIDAFELAGRRERALGLPDLRLNVRVRLECAELIDSEAAPRSSRNRFLAQPQLAIMLLDSGNLSLQRRAESDTLRAEDQLVEVLPVLRVNSYAGADILGDELSSNTAMVGSGADQVPFWKAWG